jgi:hypothetical protein
VQCLLFVPLLFTLLPLFLYDSRLVFLPGPLVPCFSPSSPRGGNIQNVPVSATSEAPEVEDSQDGNGGEDSLEDTSSTTSPPPALSKDRGIDKKRKRATELISSSTSAHTTVIGETSAPEGDVELFDLMDS